MTDKNDLDSHYREVYDAESKTYDKRSFSSKRGKFSARYKNEAILALLAKYDCLNKYATILDCPSGTGRFTHALISSNHDFGRIYAVDISEEMLKVNEKNLPAQKEKVEFAITNMKQMQFEDASFDAAVIASFVYLIPMADYKNYVADIYRVLKPGGIAIIEVSNTLCAYSPLSCYRVLKHRYIEKKVVKSSATFRELEGLFGKFEVVEYRGAEFPALVPSYGFYRAESKFLGGLPILKWFSGKFVVALRKPRQ